MTGFTRATDENNNISEYLSYSTTDGYTVLKSGWYYVRLYSYLNSNSTAAALNLTFMVNGNKAGNVYCWTNNGYTEASGDAFSIYLAEGDKVNFTAVAPGNSASIRNVEGYLYPMF